jgi:hypothetical protein
MGIPADASALIGTTRFGPSKEAQIDRVASGAQHRALQAFAKILNTIIRNRE